MNPPSHAMFVCSRKIEIDMAHRVPHHGSKCFNVHGHRYVVELRIQGPVVPLDTQRPSTQTGMVMDFGFMKDLMTRVIHNPHDHGLTLWAHDPLIELLTLKGVNEARGLKLHLMPTSPTAENLAMYWGEKIQQELPDYVDSSIIHQVHLESVQVWETPNCWARWPA